VIVRDPQGSHPAGACSIARVLRVCCLWSGRSEFLAVFVVYVTFICVVFLALILSLVVALKIFHTLHVLGRLSKLSECCFFRTQRLRITGPNECLALPLTFCLLQMNVPATATDEPTDGVLVMEMKATLYRPL
jgi:hypothetical protein